ncbi:MAG TPA: regulatory iron-sulfur-containing complex subunit RicT [Abditibacteriaceae bacterium]|jgi:cell fate regulator YaaT (PSP1 superfamily)
MPYVATCTFREPAKSYYLDPGDLEIHANDRVIAQTARGLEMGSVKWLPRDIGDDKIAGEPRMIERVATAEDIQINAENRELEADAMRIIRERCNFFGLPMKPVSAELMHDRSKLYFFYESEGRVDFRELLRDLSGRFTFRLHLQQVSPREAAGIIGGVGVCGQELCCATWLTEMPPITLKMAKDQGMALTPSKISGSCGRLMCCLRYEVDFYRDQSQRLPRPGSPVDTAEGPGHVLNVNAISEKCVVELGDGRRIVVPGETLRAIRQERGPVRSCSNHISAGGSCGGASTGGCSSGGCGKDGGCGCSSKKQAKQTANV